jgi:hypothetical protein
MVLSNHAYDNIVARVQEPASNADEFILEHPSVTGVRARVGVLNLLHHMERVTEGCHTMLQDHGHDSTKKAVIGAFENTMKSVFRAGVSDHLPVRMQILLPEEVTSSEILPKITAVAGVNIVSSTSEQTEFGLDRYPVGNQNLGPELKSAARLPDKRPATQGARQ